ncbi:MAG: endonuclease NucS [Rhodospirillaceae bacterium]|nr:endonuclease NucS [Rhodospirillaceae bacterium]
MKTDIGIWEIDRTSRAGTKLGTAERVETEEMLETVLVANPNMLVPGLKLIGRQVPVPTGYVDLLGIDEDGRLVVFELKREKLTRDAVAQILDYCSCLEVLPDSELATLITEQSGKDGITKISDFEEWYGSQGGDSIKPVRMVLVGLGIDASAERIVAFLADRGIDLEILTFQGYVRGSTLLMARHLPTSDDSQRRSVRRVRDLNRETEVNRKAIENGVADTWLDAKKALDYSRRTYFTKSGITYLQRAITLPDDVRVRGSHSLTMDKPGEIRITLYPAAVDLCREEFERLKEAIPFESEKPPNAPPTSGAPKQWYCHLDEASWRASRARLIGFVRAVEAAWRKHAHDPPQGP